MAKPRARSAGLLLHRGQGAALEVLLVHMGGPFWTGRDTGAWSIPKGEYEPDEDALAAARREFEEETGSPPPDGDVVALGEVRQSSGKVVTAWAIAGDFDPGKLRSNTFVMEWPPGSGREQAFPEVDRAAWFDPDTARTKLVRAQARFIDALVDHLGAT
jgi:predicted NUDIX family NTP pyrophosphohydrolase